MAAPINYVVGNAVHPIGEGNKIIVHICNDSGHWGAGFTAALNHRWFNPQIAYTHMKMLCIDDFLELGMVQMVKVEADIWVANLIGQHKTGNRGIFPPIRYDAVLKGLRRVAQIAHNRNASVHMPRIGCGLAGGTWDQIEPIIQRALINEGIIVTVYDLPPEVVNPGVVGGDY